MSSAGQNEGRPIWVGLIILMSQSYTVVNQIPSESEQSRNRDGFMCRIRTVARARGGVRNTPGITLKRQARGGVHLGLYCSHRVPQVGT